MTDRVASPSRTYALVVGIEQYGLGPGANLDGPAHDARAFADWLHTRGVPRENIVLLLSPLEGSKALLEEWSGPYKGPATRQAVDEAINHQLRQWAGELLYVFWAGHGIITATRSRRLFYTDTSTADWHNLVLDSLLLHTSSHVFPGFELQIYLIDTCASFERSLPRGLGGDEFLLGDPVARREQFVLFATKALERAKNLTQEQAGLFSKTVLEELAKEPDTCWPPQMEEVAERVRQRFETFAQAGIAKQTPISIDARVWDGTEHSLIQVEAAATEHPRPSQSQLSRQRMLELVHKTWITEVLEHSLHGAVPFELGLEDWPEVVDNPWRLVVQEVDTPVHPLPAGTRIMQVYDEAGGSLLILGAPGAGKTTLLLQLARDLLQRAQQDGSVPIPVVFPLSSWAKKRSPLTEWLVEELNDKYEVPRRLGQFWVSDDQLLLLLDGLDEVPSSARTECIESINSYRQAHPLVPLVVCSRSNDYLDQTVQLQLQTAVVIEPLTPKQIDAYLLSEGERVHPLRVALQEDTDLQELATTPLMLSILALVYSGGSPNEIAASNSLETKRQQIFASYVQHMLKRRGVNPRYTPEQTTHWLSWLARQLVRHSQTEFYIERMQPDWLSKRWSLRFYRCLALGPIGGLIGLLLSLLIGGSVNSHSGLLLYGLIGLLTGVLLSGGTAQIQPLKSIAWSWRSLFTSEHLRNGLGAGLAIGLVIGFISELSLAKDIGLLAAGADVLGDSLIGALIGLLSSLLIHERMAEIRPTELVSWSWRNFLKIDHLRKGLALGLVIGFVNVLIYAQIVGFLSALLYGLTYVLLGLLFSTLLIGLFGGLSSEVLEERSRVRPDEGMRRSIRNSVVITLLVGPLCGLVSGLSLGLVSGLVSGWEHGLVNALIYGFLYGLTGGLLSGLLYGGEAWIRHSILRLLLWLTRSIPWNYPRFLDYAAERILLRKVGGGYIFIHRLLLDYFGEKVPQQ